jgi:hypothetical protein
MRDEDPEMPVRNYYYSLRNGLEERCSLAIYYYGGKVGAGWT